MKVNGIIAEYNPFHNGHRHQMEESLRLTGADHTVVAMSGDFVQRGAPALADKHVRAEMALRCGADLVLELPVLYATSSAECFAAGAVALLDKLGVVTHLCFGSESGDIEALSRIAAFLLEEPECYRASLRQGLRQGLSYPAARAKALAMHAPLAHGGADALSSPNNILGIDYIKALMGRKSGMVPMTIRRAGAGYHDRSLDSPGPAVSALAIREALREGRTPRQLLPYLPEEAGRLLASCHAQGRLVRTDDFSAVLYYKLLTQREQGYESYLDVSGDLSDRIRGRLDSFTGFGAFCDMLKTKDMTYARISRCLIHILLGLEKKHIELGRSLDYVPYARVLGFRRSAAPLLRAIKEHSSIPLVTRPAQAEKKLPAGADSMFRQDILANGIYHGIVSGHTGLPARNEFTAPFVLL